MNCTEYQEQLAAHLDGILDAESNAACRQHAAQCPDCRELEESGARLQRMLSRRGPMTADVALVDSVMDRIRKQESQEIEKESERSTFMSRLLKWRWSFGMGAVASMAVLVLFAILMTPSVQVAGAEILTRAADAVAKLRGIHLQGKLRSAPADNFSSIAPNQDFVQIELWKEFEPELKWRIEKPGRIALMDGKETMLFIKPDFAHKFSKPSNSAFDTQWFQEMADQGNALRDELKAIKKNGWATAVSQEKNAAGKLQSVVTVEAKSGYSSDDYCKNAFFSTADTRRVYVFDEETGMLTGAKIFLQEPGGDKLLFELTRIEYNPSPASEVFRLTLPENVSWAEEMKVLPDNAVYEAMDSEKAARVFFEACGRKDWPEAAKFITVTGSLKEYLGGLKVVNLGSSFKSAISLINGAEFVPYEIKLDNGNVKKHNLALKRDPRTKRWFVDGGI